MTDDTSTPGSAFDSASWLLRDQEFMRLCKSILAENKKSLFDALAGARIDTVEVTFNGYADEGQIDKAVADGEERVVTRISKASMSRLRGSNGAAKSSLAKPCR